MNFLGPFNSGAAAGSAGSALASANTSHVVRGYIVGVYVKYNDSPPATTDVTISTQGTSPAPPTYNILVLTNNATNGWYYPRMQVHDTAGAALSGVYDFIPVHDILTVAIAQANAADNVDVWLMLDSGY